MISYFLNRDVYEIRVPPKKFGIYLGSFQSCGASFFLGSTCTFLFSIKYQPGSLAKRTMLPCYLDARPFIQAAVQRASNHSSLFFTAVRLHINQVFSSKVLFAISLYLVSYPKCASAILPCLL